MLGFQSIDLLRNELSKLGPWWWMGWNLFLALIPVVLAIMFFNRSDQPRRGLRRAVFFLEFGLVLLFLPNSPYVATDLIHFLEAVRYSEHNLWYLMGTEFPLYLAFVVIGLGAYAFTTDRLLFALRKRYGRAAFYSGLVLIPLLNAIGVYLGRVLRYNSWDVLRDPLNIFVGSRGILSDERAVLIILFMMIALMAVHQLYKVIHDGIRYRMEGYSSRRKAMSRLEKRENATSLSPHE